MTSQENWSIQKRIYESLRQPPKPVKPETIEDVEERIRMQFNSFHKVLPDTQILLNKLKAENDYL